MRYDGRSTRRQTKIQRRPPSNSRDQQAYWEAILAREGLSMERGRSAKLSYVGGSGEVETIEHAIAATNTGCGGGKHTRRTNEIETV